MSKAILCIATTLNQARNITDSLKSAGFNQDDISVLLADEEETSHFARTEDTRVPEGAATGASAGGLLGGALGWLVGAGALAIPGAGPFLAAGPILSALGGLAVGATAGGVGGALVGVGIPDEDAKRYESRLRDGNILISVHTDDGAEAARAKAIFEREYGEDISCSGEAAIETSASRQRAATDRDSRTPLA
ncbi:MAG: DUF3341 domain-containing protein [Candidatus Binatia bacterium]